MFFRPKTTVTLLHPEYLIHQQERALAIEKEIEEQFSAFNKGEFENLSKFEALVEEMLSIIEGNIKAYADESLRLQEAKRIIMNFFHNQLFDIVEDDVLRTIRGRFENRLQTILKSSNVAHGKRPIKTYLRQLFQGNRKLDKKLLADNRKLLELHKDEEEVRNQLYNLLMVLVREPGLMTSSVQRHEERLQKAIDHLATIVVQEFRALYDAETTEVLEEADLAKEIDLVLEKKIPREHRKKLKQIKKKVQIFFRKDVQKIKAQARH